MKKNNFILDEYISKKFNTLSDNINDYDKHSTQKDTFKRNVRNFLKNFDEVYSIENFEFYKNIFNFFPLYQLKTEEIYKFLNHMTALKLKDESKGNKLISNMKKINIDNVNISHLYLKPRITSNFQNAIDDFIYEFKIMIRTKFREPKIIIEQFNEIIADLRASNNPADLEAVTYLSSFITLQMTNYWVITIAGFQHEERFNLTQKIEQYLLDFQKEIENNNITTQSLQLDDTLLIFGEFLKLYNNYGEAVSITNKLIEEEKENPEFFKTIEEKYKVKKGWLYFEHDYKNIILEGLGNSNFAEKFENTRKAIEIFQNNGVQASDITDLMDLKVYYREIYISGCIYKTKAATIIRKMINDDTEEFEKTSEHMFLRQKITRGYFRELFPMELYSYKVKIEELMYQTLLKSMLCYDYNTSLSYLKKLVNEMTPLCYELIDKDLKEIGEPSIFV